MKTRELYKIRDIVKKILEEDELARKDDCYLIFKVVQITHPEEAGKTFVDVMLNAKKNKINLESIRRARQKVQQMYPHLKDKETADARFEEQNEYERFAIGG